MFDDTAGKEDGKALALIFETFLRERSSRRRLLDSYLSRQEEIEHRLGNIWLVYKTTHDPYWSMQTRLKDAKIATTKLRKAAEVLRDTPRSFVQMIEQSTQEGNSNVAQIIEEIDRLAGQAEAFSRNRRLPESLREIAPLRRAAASLATLYSALTGKRFARTLKTLSGEFTSDGPQLVYLLLKYIEPDLVISQVSTALRRETDSGA